MHLSAGLAMPDTFLQKFHNLASADDEVRCRAAQGIVRALQSGKLKDDDLLYTLRRLVRGVQSSRRCSRQGFSLALAEVLQAMPNQLPKLLKMLDTNCELQPGLRGNEQKERLLGRTFTYVAILQSGCLRSSKDGIVTKIGKDLWQLYSAKKSISSSSICLLKDVCAELCAAGRHSDVSEVVSHWSLDQTLSETSFEHLDANVLSLILSLRIAYEECEKKPSSWPSCVQKDMLKANVAAVARNVGQVLASCAITDVVPPVLEDFCRWWLRPHKGRDPITLQEQIWPALEEGLFPEGQAAPSMAQALRGMGELARCLGQGEGNEASQLLVGLVKLNKAWEQLFWCVSYKHSPAHQAASFAHSILVELVGGVRPPEVQSKKANKKRKRMEATARSLPAKPMSLDDDSRLLILSTLQEKKAFQKLPQNLKKQWQQALLSPLSPKGVRARCGTIISELVQGNGPPMRVVGAQLEQLAVHSKVPDEAVLVVVFQQFLASFITPGSGTVVFSLRAFQNEVTIPGLKDMEDVLLPVQLMDEEDRKLWRQKLWSTLAQLTKRTWPEAAEKLITGEDFSAAEVFSGGEEGPGSMVRSLAYQGCLADGSLLVFRLLQWWNHVVTKIPEKVSSSRKKKSGVSDSLCKCLVEFEEADKSMHKSSLELCQSIMDLEDGKSGLSARQKNAVCSLPLSLSLVMLDESAPENAREFLGELLKILEHLVKVAQGPKPKKKIAEALAAFAPVAAELYVADSLAMIREACKMTWRELAFYAADETLMGLCASVCGKAPAANDEAMEEDEDEDEDEDDDDPDGAKKAVFDKAIAAMKEKNQKAADGDEEDEEDVTTLDHSGVLSELLDDGGGQLMNSFAASSLEGATNQQSKKKKLTKRQQKLRLQQDELVRRLREADLVESFLMRCGAKRDTSLAMVEELQMALVKLNHKVKLNKEDAGEEKEEKEGGDKKKTGKKATKGDTTLRSLEETLSQRVHKMLSRLMKTSSRASSIQILAGHASVEDWAAKARALCERGQAARFNASGSQVLEVSASYLYFLCAASRAALQDGSESQGQGWDLAEELLSLLLKEWSGKKDCDNWCQAALKAFSVRVPQVLLKLPWADSIKGASKAFAQRNQLAFLCTHLLRPLPPETTTKADVATQMAFADSCALLCAELLNSTVESEEGAATQRQKLRRELLHAFKAIYKLRQRSGGLPSDVSSTIAESVTGLRDSLPKQQRRGEVYNLSIHLLRLMPHKKRDRSSSRQRPKHVEEKPDPADGEAEASEAPAKKRKGDADGEAEAPAKKRKGRSGSISRSPSLRPQSPALKPHTPRRSKKRS